MSKIIALICQHCSFPHPPLSKVVEHFRALVRTGSSEQDDDNESRPLSLSL